MATEFLVDFPTLGFLISDWIEAHCPIHDGFRKGEPFVMYEWQLWCTVNHYRVKPTAQVGQLAPAFFNRRSQVVAPQKIGKGPWSATIVAAETVGPVVFDGFAVGGEIFDCRDYGCGCGWGYEYEPGEPMGIPWPTPIFQCLATSEDQVDNVWRPLQLMIKNGPLSERLRPGEEFIRHTLSDDGRIDKVTSSAQSRLGNPITGYLQDENGLYTKANKLLNVAQTMRRGCAGMGGRGLSTTNAWDPAEQSDAQRTAESKRPDIFRFHRTADPALKFRIKEQRRKILAAVYAGATHIDLDSIEAECAELMESDPEQAERFYGNRIVVGGGAWMEQGLWKASEHPVPMPPPAGTPVVAGFDGSDSDDFTAIRLCTLDGYRFTPTFGPDKTPTIWNPAEHRGQIPRDQVHAAWEDITKQYRLKRAYCDPPGWQSEVGDWALKYGAEVFVEWPTYRVVPMHAALDRSLVDLKSGRSTHDACPSTELAYANARKIPRPGQRYILGKPSQHQKIDAAMADTLAAEACADLRESGDGKPKRAKGKTHNT